MTKPNRYKPIRLHIESPERVFDEYRREISKAIIEAIAFAIRNKKQKVDFAHIVVKNFLVITLSIDNREFVDLIDENLQNLIEFEDYETCAVAVKLKNKIEKANAKKVIQKDRVDI